VRRRRHSRGDNLRPGHNISPFCTVNYNTQKHDEKGHPHAYLRGALVLLGVLEEVLGDLSRFRRVLGFGRRHRAALGLAGAVLLGAAGLAWLRGGQFETYPETYLYLEVAGTFLSFCYAANALVRFRGTHDRIALILAFGFVTSGLIETVGYFGLRDLLERGPSALSHVPMGWMVGRTLLGTLLLAAIVVERNIPMAR